MNRREFLKHTAVLTLTAVILSNLPTRPLSAISKPLQGVQSNSNKPVLTIPFGIAARGKQVTQTFMPIVHKYGN